MNGLRESGDKCWTFFEVGYLLIGVCQFLFFSRLCFLFHLNDLSSQVLRLIPSLWMSKNPKKTLTSLLSLLLRSMWCPILVTVAFQIALSRSLAKSSTQEVKRAA